MIELQIEVIDIIFFVWLVVLTKAEFSLFKMARKPKGDDLNGDKKE